jgi:3-hydroxybutyryl-CoA dehydrogenase
MFMSELKNVTVIGGGTMGNGIAQIFALGGFDVNLTETKKELADRAIRTIDKNLSRMVSKEKIGEEEKRHCIRPHSASS